MEKSRHMKTLWSIVSGANQPASVDLVGPFIESAHPQLIQGVQFYRRRPADASTTENDFASILSQAINLEKSSTDQLINIYKEDTYRGNPEQFEALLKNKHHHGQLLQELWQFYHSERLYLLHCIEFVIKQAGSQTHPYAGILAGFLETYDSQQQLKQSLIQQWQSLCASKPPPVEGLITTALVRAWWCANLREQLLVLQCLIHYSSRQDFTVQDLVDILTGCAAPQAKDVEEQLYFNLLHLESVLLIKLMAIASKEKFTRLKSQSASIENHLQRISTDRREFSPVLLAWMLGHYTHCPNDLPEINRAQQFGEKAIQQRVLKVMGDICSDATLVQGKSSLGELVCSTIYDVFRLLVECFDTERLGTPEDLRSAAVALLRSDHVANEFWRRPDQGVNLVWKECTLHFPLQFIPLLSLAEAIAKSTTDSRSKLVEALADLDYFLEPMDAVPEPHFKRAGSDVVALIQTHYPYKHVNVKEVVIPRGTLGQIDGKQVRWEVKANLFDVASGEIHQLLQQASFGLAAVKMDTLNRVQKFLAFLEIVFSQLEATWPDRSRILLDLVLSLTDRFRDLSSVRILAGCLSCLAASVNRANASQIAGKLFATSILPSLEHPGRDGLLPGVIGAALAGVECPQRSYPLTSAFLKLTTAFVKAELADGRITIPSTLFILREVLPFVLTWQYDNAEQRESLTDLCLGFLHQVLQQTKGNQVQEVVIRDLLDSEAKCLVTLATVGPSQAEMQLMRQANWEDQSGHGTVLLRHIRLALSILNQLLNSSALAGGKKAKMTIESGLTRLETSLSQQRYVTVLASYIFLRFDPRPATLALRILRTCASRWTNVSLLACLGQDAALIRNTWLDCLESSLEDVSLLRSVLRLMTDAVVGQPGLMHMLVNGEDRCLKAVARLLDASELEALKLVHQFWTQRCSPAVEFFKKLPEFWAQLCRPLLAVEKAGQVGRAALVFGVVAVELYNTAGRVSTDMQKVLDRLPPHLPDWSNLVLTEEAVAVELLPGWSDFMTMAAHYGPPTIASLRSQIRHDVLEALIQRTGAPGQHPPKTGKLAELHWMLQLVEKDAADDVVNGLGRLLNLVADREWTSFPARFQAAVMTCAVATARLRMVANRSAGCQSPLALWMRPAALCAKACLLQLPGILLAAPLDRSGATSMTALCLSLVAELVAVSQADLGALRETFLLQIVVSTVQFCIHHRCGWDVAETALSVLLAVAGTDEGSKALTCLQLDQTLWLPLETVYRARPSVYRLGVQLCTIMLANQRHFFLKESLTLVGVHQQPMTDALLKLRRPTGDDVVLALDILSLLRQLSVFQHAWRLQHAPSLQSVFQAASAAVYYSVSHLVRAKVAAAVQPEGDEITPAALEHHTHLLDLVSQGLALLSCFSPPLVALLTEDGIDVARWERHLNPSFGSPSPDHADQSPPSLSFGTLNAAASHCLRVLSKSDAQLSAAERTRLNLVLEQSLSLLLSQALLYMLDPRLCPQEKQLLKRELGAELGSFVESIRRQTQRGMRSPAGGSSAAAALISRQISASPVGDQSFLKLLGHIVQRIFK